MKSATVGLIVVIVASVVKIIISSRRELFLRKGNWVLCVSLVGRGVGYVTLEKVESKLMYLARDGIGHRLTRGKHNIQNVPLGGK